LIIILRKENTVAPLLYKAIPSAVKKVAT